MYFSKYSSGINKYQCKKFILNDWQDMVTWFISCFSNKINKKGTFFNFFFYSKMAHFLPPELVRQVNKLEWL